MIALQFKSVNLVYARNICGDVCPPIDELDIMDELEKKNKNIYPNIVIKIIKHVHHLN